MNSHDEIKSKVIRVNLFFGGLAGQTLQKVTSVGPHCKVTSQSKHCSEFSKKKHRFKKHL